MAKTIICELTDRKPSGFIREGSAESGLALHLDAPSLLKLPNTSVIVVENGKFEKIRYIRGCDTLKVSEQKTRGIEPNPQFDAVFFEDAVLSVPGGGDNDILVEYLRVCEYNESNKNRPKTARTLFREVNTEIKAQKATADIDEIADNLTYMKGLRTKTGPAEYEYDTAIIESLIKVFNVKGGGGDSPAEQFKALCDLATYDPAFFKARIGEATSAVRIAIMEAREMGCIVMNDDEASFKQQVRTFYKFKTAAAESRLEELIQYFINPKNAEDYKHMLLETGALKEKAL